MAALTAKFADLGIGPSSLVETLIDGCVTDDMEIARNPFIYGLAI